MKQFSLPRAVLITRIVFLFILVAGIVFVATRPSFTSRASNKPGITTGPDEAVRKSRSAGSYASDLKAFTLSPPCTTNPIVINNSDSGAGSLRQAIVDACASSTITFNMAMVTSPITLTSAELSISKNLAITGPGSSVLTIQRSAAGGTPQFRIFNVGSGTVSISGVTVTNGRTGDGIATVGIGGDGDNGGGVLNSGALTLADVLVNANRTGDGGTGSGNQGGKGGAGGGIYNSGTLTMTNCAVNGNFTGKGGGGPFSGNGGSGGGVYNSNTLTMTSCAISGNTCGNSGDGTTPSQTGGRGGGLYSAAGVLTLTNITVSDNVTGDSFGTNNDGFGGQGGGIYTASGVVMLANSTVRSNRTGLAHGGADGYAGGIDTECPMTIIGSTISGNTGNSAGAILNQSSLLKMINSTVSGNQTFNDAGAAVVSNGGSLTNCTLTENVGFGVAVSNPASVRNTIIASNGTGADLNGTLSSQGNNLIGKSNGSNGFTNGSNGDQVGSVASPLNARLGPLANNGGPTQTHALLADSTAIDAGNNCVLNNSCSPSLGSSLTTDQRGAGFNRAVDGNGDGSVTVDIGAYEVQSLLVTNTADSGAGSLRQAITDANANPDTNPINFQAGLTGTISLSTGLLLSSSMSINGPGANKIILQRSTADGTPNFSTVTISNGTLTGPTVVISGLTVSNGRLGGIFNDRSTITINNCVISGNDFAGINNGSNQSGTVTVNNSIVSNNNGPGIYNRAGTGSTTILTISNSTISGNATSGVFNSGDGGNATVTVNSSTLSGNNDGSGTAGAVENSAAQGGSATAAINNSTLSGNHAADGALFAGGIENQAGSGSTATATITNTTIFGNSPSGGSSVGGIINTSISGGTATLLLRNSIVAGNFHNSGASASDISGTVDPASSFNLIGTGGSGGLINGVNNNQVGIANPKLGPLADNGGPTLTHALLSGSPAIDAGNNSVVTNPPFTGPPFTDQRSGSFSRIADGDGNSTAIVDIGAYELQGILTIDKVTPPAGRVSGGQQIVLAGGFANLSTVTMGGAAASWSYTNGASDTSIITVTTPAHAVGAVQIDLTPTSGSPYSKVNAFAYLPTVFTDDTIMVGQTTAKAQHIIELRQAVDAMRAVAGSSGAPWTDPSLAAGDTIKAVHILDLRTYLDDAATRLGYSTSAYTDPTLTTGFVIKRIHIEELRQRIRIIAG